jgi:cytochrome P450
LDKLQDNLFAFTMQFVERKFGSSTSWSEPTDITPLLVEGTMQVGAWTLCGRHLAETHGTELAENMYVLENDMSILGLVLNFPTPAVRRRNKAKRRMFEIIQQEFRERVRAIQEGKEIDDDFMSAVLRECLDDKAMASGDEEEIMKAIKKTIYIIYGLIWAVSNCNPFFCVPYRRRCTVT